MSKASEEADERGEESNAPETVAPETPVPETTAPELGAAKATTGNSLVSEDEDRPVADNKLPPPTAPVTEAPGASEPGNVAPPSTSKRGRPKMTDEQKAQAKQIRDAVKAGKPPPDFSSLNKGGTSSGTIAPAKAPRDYYLEACSIFIPVSMMGSKFLGEHWAVPIVDKVVNGITQKAIEPTEEQKQYLAQFARWLEYEQFPEVNPRWGFAIATLGYTIPKAKQSPTPERLATAWEWIRVKILRREPRAPVA